MKAKRGPVGFDEDFVYRVHRANERLTFRGAGVAPPQPVFAHKKGETIVAGLKRTCQKKKMDDSK